MTAADVARRPVRILLASVGDLQVSASLSGTLYVTRPGDNAVLAAAWPDNGGWLVLRRDEQPSRVADRDAALAYITAVPAGAVAQ